MVWALAPWIWTWRITLYVDDPSILLDITFETLDPLLKIEELVLQVVDILMYMAKVRRIYPLSETTVCFVVVVLHS